MSMFLLNSSSESKVRSFKLEGIVLRISLSENLWEIRCSFEMFWFSVEKLQLSHLNIVSTVSDFGVCISSNCWISWGTDSSPRLIMEGTKSQTNLHAHSQPPRRGGCARQGLFGFFVPFHDYRCLLFKSMTCDLFLGFVDSVNPHTLCLHPFENVQFLPKSLDIDTPKCTAQGPSSNRFPLQLAQVTAVQWVGRAPTLIFIQQWFPNRVSFDYSSWCSQ